MTVPLPTDLVSIARAEADRVEQIGPALTHRLCDEIERLRASQKRIAEWYATFGAAIQLLGEQEASRV